MTEAELAAMEEFAAGCNRVLDACVIEDLVAEVRRQRRVISAYRRERRARRLGGVPMADGYRANLEEWVAAGGRASDLGRGRLPMFVGDGSGLGRPGVWDTGVGVTL